jgi:hypothetical protein
MTTMPDFFSQYTKSSIIVAVVATRREWIIKVRPELPSRPCEDTSDE